VLLLLPQAGAGELSELGVRPLALTVGRAVALGRQRAGFEPEVWLGCRSVTAGLRLADGAAGRTVGTGAGRLLPYAAPGSRVGSRMPGVPAPTAVTSSGVLWR